VKKLLQRCWHQPNGRPAAGQTLVLFAVALLTLMSALGLVLDGGYDYIQRRAMQNTADAAAMAGAQAVSQNQTDTQVTQAVLDAAARNGVTDASNVTCSFITNSYVSDGATQPCTSTGTLIANVNAAPNYVTGVLVRVAEQHPTFAMRAVGILQSGTAASAAAQVQVVTGIPGGPFVVCGINTAVVSAPAGWSGGIFRQNGFYPNSGPPNYTRTDGNANCQGGPCGMTLDDANGRPVINQNAYYFPDGSLTSPYTYTGSDGNTYNGPVFLIHDPNSITACNDNSSSFKGVNTNAPIFTYNNGLDYWTAGSYVPPITTGNVSSVTATVQGINGCQAGAALNNCIMILPIVDNSGPGGTGINTGLAVRMLGAFYIKQIASGSHTGQLIKTYKVVGNTNPYYVPGTGAPTLIRLIK
jgi:Flp pilus assembly protein TadG